VPASFPYRVEACGIVVNVENSPATINVPSHIAAGPYVATIVWQDSDLHPHGPVLSIPFELPVENTLINVPVSGNATVIVS
jgi:hypothetical protein